MKGQGKRFLNHKGKPYSFNFKRRSKDGDTESIGFLDLWRYAHTSERLVTLLAVLLSWVCSCGLIGAIVVYGELTSLFVQRHKMEPASGVHILSLFGGGHSVTSENRTVYMDALVEDSIAFAVASFVIMLIQLVIAAVAITIANWAASRMVSRLRCELLRSALRQELAFFDTNKSFNFATAITEDIDKIRLGVGSHVVMCGYLIGSVVAAAATGLAMGWQLTLAGLSVVPLATLAAAQTAKYQTRYSSREVSAYSAAGRVVQEALAGVRTVRAYGGEEVEVDRYVSLLKPAMEAARSRGLVTGVGSGLGWLLTYALNALVLSYGARLCVRDMDLPPEDMEYHPGVLVTILFCTFMAAQNIAMCHPHLEMFSHARAAAKSIYRMLERRSRIDALNQDGIKPERFRGDIQFDNVYFNYPSRPDVKVLRGFNLSVTAGSTVALVGGSGSGKSTVLQLLQRLYEPQQGSVTLDGHRLDALNLHHYTNSIGVVGQEPVLFSGSIRDNITLGMRDVTEEQLVAAAKTALAHHFIVKLADGYDTQLGERGAQLSGGQKQRIAIARAVIRQPSILLLDEPTSALDPTSERQVQAALDSASQGRTTIVVSHRLSTIVNCTSIVYMEHGAALEQGTYTELLEKKGLFWKLLEADMTSKSAMAASLAEATLEEEEERVFQNVEQPFTRALSLVSNRSESAAPERCLRGSKRLGTVSSARIPNVAAPDILEYVEPEEEASSPAGPEPTTWQLLKLNAEEWPLLLGGGVSSFLLGSTMPGFAMLFSRIYGMFASSDKEYILSQSALYAGLFAGVAALCGVVTFLQTWLLNLAGTKLTRRLRKDTFTAVLKQEQAWLDQPSNSVGAVCARLASDCAAIQGATGTRLGTMLQGGSTMLIGVTLAMCYSWKMTLVSLISVPCVMAGIYLESYVMQKSAAAERRAMEQASKLATEAILNIRTVHSLGVEESLLERYRASLTEASNHNAISGRLRGPVYGLCLCAPTLGYAVSMAYGGYLVARDNMPYEYAILVSEALIYGAWMLAEALAFAPNFAAAKRSGARILSVLNREPAIVSEPTAVDDPNWCARGEITYKSVSFHYPSRPHAQVLRDLSLRVEPGKTVALVGPSGCGKSTLMQLLLRMYEPSSGTVELDGKDIKRSLALARLRSQLGLVQQEPVLFERTIRENIEYGDNSRAVSVEEVVAAAQQANIHTFIAALPMGYETMLGSSGADLSGGQKQRVAIARALVRDPKILLLDEATSALDANSEKVVQAALEKAASGRTTIMIAHRLATVQHADTIAVIDRGVVAEQGSHQELVRRRGLYYELLQQQGPSEPSDDPPAKPS